MNTCQFCAHWRASKTSLRADTGECRAATPLRDFHWPRTRSIDGCAKFERADATGKPSGAITPPRLADPAPLLLDAELPGQPSSPTKRQRRGKPLKE
jgi:hypothetical protein